MDLLQELIDLHADLLHSANFINDDDDERDRYARQAYTDSYKKLGEIIEREQKSPRNHSI